MTWSDLLPFVSSLAIGLLVGFERERSHRSGTKQSAGSRTFALLALSGTLTASFGTWLIAAGLLVVGTLLAIGYGSTSADDPGATTEVAAMATFLLGALAWTHTALAAGLAIIVILLLTTKGRLHRFAREVVTDAEVEDAIKFLVMAFVVLPLLPNRNMGPYGVLNPERIWQLVLALTGISWAGYIATRALGPRRGLLITGLAGGFISATATTVSLGRLSRATGQLRATITGAYLASVATFAQLAGIIAVADRELLDHLWPALVAGGVALIAIAAVNARWHKADPVTGDSNKDPEPQQSRPFGLRPALMLAGMLTLALLLGRWVVDVLGPRATSLASGAAGLADAHAGALAAATLHQRGQIDLSTALIAVGVALCANTVVKCVLAFASGGRRFGLRFTAGIVPAFALSFGVVALAAVAA